MPNRAQINLRIDPEMKQHWEEALPDHPEACTLTDLIRISVTHELLGRTSETDSSRENSRIGEVLEGIQAVQDSQEDLMERVANLEREVRHRPEVTDMAARIYDRLPTLEPGSEDWRMRIHNYEPNEWTVWPGDIASLAEALEEPAYKIREGAEYLQENVIAVRSVTVDGSERYWRTE